MSNKCHHACQSFAKTIKKFAIATFVSAFTAVGSAHASENSPSSTTNAKEEQTYVSNIADKKKSVLSLLRRESPCDPKPVIKMTPQGTITKMEVSPTVLVNIWKSIKRSLK